MIVESATHAVLVTQACNNCPAQVQRNALRDGGWGNDYGSRASEPVIEGVRDALSKGRVEIRVVPRRQVFVDGGSVGEVLDGGRVAVEARRSLR